jgi:hypothetical protein
MMVDSRKGLDEAGRFESYLRSQSFNNLAPAALCLRSVSLESEPSDLDACGSHLIRYNVPVNLKCGSDVRVAHHLLLYGHGCAHGI